MRCDAELGDYMGASRQTKPPLSSKKPLAGKRLGLAAVAAVIVCAGLATFTDTKPDRRAPSGAASRAEPAPSLGAPAPPASPLPSGSAEYLSADLPTKPSYNPSHGTRYDAARRSFGPVDATITRNRPGDYTIDLPDLADPDDTIQVVAYDSPSICYSAESQAIGVDEHIRVLCVRLLRYAFPVFTTPIDSRFTVALIQPPRL
jgi:hypothetical protein